MKIKNASATSEMMADFENQIGGPLPEELKNLLLESNGGTPFHGFVATKEYEGDICQFFDVVYHLDSKKGALSLNYYFDFFQRTYKDENFPEDLICFAGGQGIQWAIGFKGSRKHKIYLLDFDGIQGPIPKVVLMFETLEEFFNHLVPEFIEPI